LQKDKVSYFLFFFLKQKSKFGRREDAFKPKPLLQGILTEGVRLSTVDLLTKFARFALIVVKSFMNVKHSIAKQVGARGSIVLSIPPRLVFPEF
jgi:hypothetical protein